MAGVVDAWPGSESVRAWVAGDEEVGGGGGRWRLVGWCFWLVE